MAKGLEIDKVAHFDVERAGYFAEDIDADVGRA